MRHLTTGMYLAASHFVSQHKYSRVGPATKVSKLGVDSTSSYHGHTDALDTSRIADSSPMLGHAQQRHSFYFPTHLLYTKALGRISVSQTDSSFASLQPAASTAGTGLRHSTQATAAGATAQR
eukprot:scpid60995/ scgid19714/ 